MNLNLFFQISKEFFEAIHSPYIDYNNSTKHNLLPDEENDLINYKELFDSNRDVDVLCDCNLCYVIRQLIIFINPQFFKAKLN